MTDKFDLHPQLIKDGIEIAELPLCKLLLCNDANYPWFILVPRRDDIQEIYQLDWQDQQQLLNESSLLGEVLMQLYQGDKLNVAALGNICPQLHYHHIVRFKNDPAWPKPVWGQMSAVPYNDSQIQAIKDELLPKLASILVDSFYEKTE